MRKTINPEDLDQKQRIEELLSKYSEETPKKQTFSAKNTFKCTCEVCKRPFTSLFENSRFCSKPCCQKWLSDNPKICANPKCKKPYTAKTLKAYYRQKFCCNQCSRYRKPYSCEFCGRDLSNEPFRIRTNRFCEGCYEKYLQKLRKSEENAM
jgi:hypothetical protein